MGHSLKTVSDDPTKNRPTPHWDGQSRPSSVPHETPVGPLLSLSGLPGTTPSLNAHARFSCALSQRQNLPRFQHTDQRSWMWATGRALSQATHRCALSHPKIEPNSLFFSQNLLKFAQDISDKFIKRGCVRLFIADKPVNNISVVLKVL